VHVRDLDERWTDTQIWEYAKSNELVIVSKDADFTSRALLSAPPPRVVHICIGNASLRELRSALDIWWPIVETVVDGSRIVSVFRGAISTLNE
jgi:predicted nuclease of predicted toxin-antitoxin system